MVQGLLSGPCQIVLSLCQERALWYVWWSDLSFGHNKIWTEVILSCDAPGICPICFPASSQRRHDGICVQPEHVWRIPQICTFGARDLTVDFPSELKSIPEHLMDVVGLPSWRWKVYVFIFVIFHHRLERTVRWPLLECQNRHTNLPLGPSHPYGG